MSDSSHDRHLFVVGASAGGIDALERLVRSLPETFSAPIVVAQHLAPSQPSHLAEILTRQTRMRVVALDGATALAKGTIYLIPPGKHGEIDGETVILSDKLAGQRPQPSIDLLFESAVAAYGEGVVAVVLSGTGTDGAKGAAMVKEAGGTVVVQDAESAAYPAMPGSIPPNHVDLVANIDTMGALLSALADNDLVAENETDPDSLRAFLSQLRARSGIDFQQYKTPTVMRRLSRLMTGAHCKSLSEYVRYLDAHPEGYQQLVSSFLIKVTGFFRDPALFEELRSTVLPELIAQARDGRAELRLWCAGCATGEEPYSLAILLAELLGNEVEETQIRIFATDLDSQAIRFARRAVYPPNSLSAMPPELVSKYFTKIDHSFQVKKRIRNLTVFGEYDLGQRAPFPRIDLILCRNVLIYFTKELQQRTLALFAFSLRSGGYLVLGKSETTRPLAQYFAISNPTLKVFRRQGDRLLIPAPEPADGGGELPERPSIRRHALRATSHDVRHAAVEAAAPRWSLTERLGAFLFDSPIGVVVVDRDYDIQTINQAARGMLGVRGQGIGDDLIHVASEVAPQKLKALLDNAFRSEMPAADVEIEVEDSNSEQTRFLQIACYPDKTSTRDGRTGGVIVLVIDVTESSRHRRELEAQTVEQHRAIDRFAEQSNELHRRQRALVEANAELTAANNDLRSANEHLLVAAEEAEASAEEVETLNEEMQATSEELETLNEELQATVEELNTTNDELAARGVELEGLAGERHRGIELFTSIIERLPFPAVVLDERSKIVAASAPYVELSARNPGRLGSPGDVWSSVPARVESLAEGNGHATSYAVTDKPAARGGRLIVLSPT